MDLKNRYELIRVHQAPQIRGQDPRKPLETMSPLLGLLGEPDAQVQRHTSQGRDRRPRPPAPVGEIPGRGDLQWAFKTERVCWGTRLPLTLEIQAFGCHRPSCHLVPVPTSAAFWHLCALSCFKHLCLPPTPQPWKEFSFLVCSPRLPQTQLLPSRVGQLLPM